MKDPCAECQLREQRNKCFQNRELPDTSAEEDGSGVRGDAARGFRSADTPVLKAVIESSSDCILVLDRECRTLYANPAAIRHAMTTKDNLIGKSIREALAHVPDLMQTAMNRVDAVFQSGEKMHFTDKVHIGNRIVFNESTLSPVHDEKGRMFAVSVIYRDITEQKMWLRNWRAANKNTKSCIIRPKSPCFAPASVTANCMSAIMQWLFCSATRTKRNVWLITARLRTMPTPPAAMNCSNGSRREKRLPAFILKSYAATENGRGSPSPAN